MQPNTLHRRVIKGYEILDPIDEGGFGAIYRAYQTAVGREVAVKVILPRYANRPNFIRRFEAEAQLVARLEHLHIVPLYDYWRDPDGAYLVMRWLRGGSLREDLDTNGAWDIFSANRLLGQTVMALASAHQAGVTHRDLKPGNILLDEEKNAYLADFGIALLGDEDAAEDSMVGSPAYMSPEQIGGGIVTPLSDQYSLGVVMYHVLIGEPPFGSLSNRETLLRQLREPMPSLLKTRPDMPPALDDVLQRATAKQAEDRFSDILEFANAFYQAAFARAADATRITDTSIVLPEIRNPYKGLRAFKEADAPNFFGRDRLVSRLVSRLGSRGFVALLGPSGSGKSSVVSAGLIPALRTNALEGSQKWFFAEMTPGAHPMHELEAALLRVASGHQDGLPELLRESENGLRNALTRVLPANQDIKLLLFVDQFEEVFTQVTDEAARTLFLKSLFEAVNDEHSRIRLVITMRADFYDRPLQYENFGELLREHTEVVLPLSYEELEATITDPAERAGLQLEPGLVNNIIEDVRQQPGTLPLLQYALTELFEQRDGRTLTLSAYRDIGGVSGALVRRAEEVYNLLDADHKEVTRQVFLRLVNVGAEDTRRRAYLSELPAEESRMWQTVLDTFGKYRLLTFDNDPITREPIVHIAHEALIWRWSRLNNWLNDSREELQLQRRLVASVDEWLNAERDSSFLADGMRLQQFEDWRQRTELAFNDDEIDYLDESIKQRNARIAEEAERSAREAALERRSQRQLRVLAGVLFAATVIALILASLAAVERQDAQDARLLAETAAERAADSAREAFRNANEAARNADQAQSLALASSAQLALSDDNTDLAIALGLQATTRLLNPPQEARWALGTAALRPGTRRLFTGHANSVWQVVVTPDGRTAISSGLDGQIIMWNLEDGAEVGRLSAHESPVRSLALQNDVLLSGDDSGQILHWILTDSPRPVSFEGSQGAAVFALDISPDGQTAVSGGSDGSIILWDIATRQQARSWQSTGGEIWVIAFDPSGDYIYAGSENGTVSRWETESGLLTNRFEGHTAAVRALAISLDGGTMLTASADNSARYWDLDTGATLRELHGHGAGVYSVIFDPDGQTAFSGSQDGSIIQWRLDNGTQVQHLEGHTGAVSALAFIPGTQRMLSGSFDGTLRLWDTVHGLQRQTFTGHIGDVLSAAYSPDGRTAITAGSDHSLILWDINQGRIVRRFYGHVEAVRAVAYLPDSQHAVSGSDDHRLIVWDLATGSPIRALDGHTDQVRAVAVSPDGRYALSGSSDNTAILWNLETGEITRRLEGHTNWIGSVAISPDGKTALTGSADATVIYWNLETGEIIHQLTGHQDWVSDVIFERSGRFAASSGSDSRIIYWDLETGTIIRQIEGHSGPVYGIGFTPDGGAIISGSADHTLRVWDVNTGAEISRLTGHSAEVFDVAVEHFGRFVLSGGGDGTVRLWQIPYSFNNVVEWTFSNRYVRELTCVERSTYRVLPLCD